MELYMYGVIYGVVGERLAFDRPHTEPPVRGATLASILNELSVRGWEYVSLTGANDRVVCLVRKRVQAQAARAPQTAEAAQPAGPAQASFQPG